MSNKPLTISRNLGACQMRLGRQKVPPPFRELSRVSPAGCGLCIRARPCSYPAAASPAATIEGGDTPRGIPLSLSAEWKFSLLRRWSVICNQEAPFGRGSFSFRLTSDDANDSPPFVRRRVLYLWRGGGPLLLSLLFFRGDGDGGAAVLFSVVLSHSYISSPPLQTSNLLERAASISGGKMLSSHKKRCCSQRFFPLLVVGLPLSLFSRRLSPPKRGKLPSSCLDCRRIFSSERRNNKDDFRASLARNGQFWEGQP